MKEAINLSLIHIFYDAVFNELYHKEENLRSLITVFSLLAIIISLVGVFNLVVFDTQYRWKEIGLRKVHGATIGEVLKMLNSSYIYIVLICFVLAVPVGYYGINKWLESFAYKTPMFWWVYPLAVSYTHLPLSGLLYYLFPAGTGTERQFRTVSQREVAQKYIGQYPVYCFIYSDYQFPVYVFAEPVYAEYTAWI